MDSTDNDGAALTMVKTDDVGSTDDVRSTDDVGTTDDGQY